MTYDADKLMKLLPAIHRIRDAEEGGQLREFLGVLAEQAAILEEDLEQLYDDQFIETCAEWVAPYIGSLIGYRTLHGVTPKVASPRADVANTIAYRRRKGTATVLEQIAFDVTGWRAHAVEFFERLTTTQYMNHIRPHSEFTASMRRWEPLRRIDSAFDGLSHTVDVRSIARRAGRYNIPNIGLFLWRLLPLRLSTCRAASVSGSNTKFRFNPLGIDAPLFVFPEEEDEIAHLSQPINVPEPLLRRVLSDRKELYYGPGLSILVKVGNAEITEENVSVCNLSDNGWEHPPNGVSGLAVAIDPELGRMVFNQSVTEPVHTTFHHGFSAAMGGGQYARDAGFTELLPGQSLQLVQADGPNNASHSTTIQDALDKLPAPGGIVEITDNEIYQENITIAAAAGASIELRAADGKRPVLRLSESLTIEGGENSAVTINGLLIAGGRLDIPEVQTQNSGNPNEVELVTLRHVTIVPGRDLTTEGRPVHPGKTSIEIHATKTSLRTEHCIIGAVRASTTPEDAGVFLTDSIIDATESTRIAYAGANGSSPDDFGRPLSMVACTVIGKIRTECFPLVSNCILDGKLARNDTWPAPVHAQRTQSGCVRFSFVPHNGITPRQYRCQPRLAIREAIAEREKAIKASLPDSEKQLIAEHMIRTIQPIFNSECYGRPPYMQLALVTSCTIRAGADDESEMGAFHGLYGPQRETNLRIRLDEYLRFSLDAGIFYET